MSNSRKRNNSKKEKNKNKGATNQQNQQQSKKRRTNKNQNNLKNQNNNKNNQINKNQNNPTNKNNKTKQNNKDNNNIKNQNVNTNKNNKTKQNNKKNQKKNKNNNPKQNQQKNQNKKKKKKKNKTKTKTQSEKEITFKQMPIISQIQFSLEKQGFVKPTEIQRRSIPPFLDGKDILGNAKTGSGKTLAFMIPCAQLLHKGKFQPRNGVGCLIIAPTRELVLQIMKVAEYIMANQPQTFGHVIGGTDKSEEARKLRNGINLLVATPGRLLDHLQNTRGFVIRNLQCFVIDEADRVLENGFEEELTQIVKYLPKKRQTVLFSATQTRRIKDLAKLSFKEKPMYIGVHDDQSEATVETLEQGYVICPQDKKFLILFTFLRRNHNKKVIVFFSSVNSVKYHHELLKYLDVDAMFLHGKQKQKVRTNTFNNFVQATEGILLCTNIAARGLDIPEIDWIIQVDPPQKPREYIHRVGRTARAGKCGKAIILILQPEVDFLKYLRLAKIPLNEYEIPESKIVNIQRQLEAMIEKNYSLKALAIDAFRSFFNAYDSHFLKEIFDINKLHKEKIARSFGLTSTPQIHFTSNIKKKKSTLHNFDQIKNKFKKNINMKK
ncbi:atp-dependent RNA helicase ddx18 [Anaeramoeba flamelloides]|uniref:ATP-dependent RNA helicase n=1 Tax=Anaeramoeba flamelloides TaxID=1746091 RepID=A0AAV7ZHH5_9EUKA|nr:atp-dependent RNA helicase ddx18 [Anaeramoeba flamelloides]